MVTVMVLTMTVKEVTLAAVASTLVPGACGPRIRSAGGNAPGRGRGAGDGMRAKGTRWRSGTPGSAAQAAGVRLVERKRTGFP